MQPCDELKNIVMQHYGEFHSGDQAHSIKDTYSRQEGVVIIGNDPKEWFDDRESIITFMKAGGSSKMEIPVQNIKAYCEGTVGWTMDRVKVRLPNEVELPIRHTHATRAAVEQGIVPGGGVALIRASMSLDKVQANDEEKVGVRIVRRAMEEPARRIAGNAGADGSVIVGKIKEGKDAFGFNAATEKFEDMIKAGIIDPTKVVRTALPNASSVAGLLLTTEAMIAEKPKKKDGAPQMPGGGGGMEDYDM